MSAINAADHRAVKDHARAEKRRREKDQAHWRRLMAESWSREWLWERLAETGQYEDPFVLSGSAMYYNAGRRQIGLNYLKEITTLCPAEYVSMIEEANARHTKQEQTHDDTSHPGGLTPRPGSDPDPASE